MERSDWSVGHCLQTSAMLFTYGFRKFISNVNVLTFEKYFKIFISK